MALAAMHHFTFFFLFLVIRAQNSSLIVDGKICPAGFELEPTHRNKCFGLFKPNDDHSNNATISTTNATWYDAESQCRKHFPNAHLASLTTSQEFAIAHRLCSDAKISKHGAGCWVGGIGESNGITLSWRWSDDVSPWNKSFLANDYFIEPPVSSFCTLLTNTHLSSVVPVTCTGSHQFICMLHSITDNKCMHSRCHKDYIIILSVISALILFGTLSVILWLLVYKTTKKRSRKNSKSPLVPPEWRLFTGDELRQVTKNFSDGNRLIGDAKTGGTFSGLMPDGSRIAVKRLKRSNFQRKKEFFSQVRSVARLQHPNLVALKGWCYDHGDRYIVYQFVANGPLDRWLHCVPRGGRTMDWAMRINIATTLAQGIAFLHDKVKPHVVHRDIRASNVLLDEEFGAHLMGVGLSKFVPWEVMHERTVKAATYGYLAPEFVYRNELTTKGDVYSFGVLLLEIVSGRRPCQEAESVSYGQSIFEWATPLVQTHSYIDLLDPVITQYDIPELGIIQKVVELIYACTQHVPSVRPRMSHVVHQLLQLGLKNASSSSSASEKTRFGSSTSTTPLMMSPSQEVELIHV